MPKQRYDPDGLANEMVDSLQLDHWRSRIANDPQANRWQHLFEKIEPQKMQLQPLLKKLIMATGGSIASDFLYAMLLSAWTYGTANAFSMLADEDITLWEGQPLDFPDADPDNHNNEPKITPPWEG